MSKDPSTWWWVFRVNLPRGWRQHVGQWLRRLAARIDGRWSLAIEVRTDPPIDSVTTRAVIRAGMKHAERLLTNETEAAACDRVMRARMPDLFRDLHG